MSLTALFKQKTVFSLEVFPPKKDSPTDAILPTLKRLQSLQPDFISVTLGAGGTNHCDGTVAVADLIQNQLNIPAVSHVPGLYQSKDQVLALLDRLDQIHVKNILALRGDRIPGKEPVGDFNHANELVKFVHNCGEFLWNRHPGDLGDPLNLILVGTGHDAGFNWDVNAGNFSFFLEIVKRLIVKEKLAD